MNKSTIAVIIPCYNGAKYLGDAIKSVVSQSYRSIEIFLIDNGSTDNSLNIMKYYKNKDNRIKIIRNKKKTSRAKSLNNFIKKINFKWVCLFDADDVMFKNKIKTQIKYLNNNPKVKVLSNLATYISDGHNTFGKSVMQIYNHKSAFNLVKNKKNISIMISGAIIDRQTFLKVNGFRHEYWPCDDTDLLNRIAENKCVIYVLPKILIKYRIHYNSVTTGNFFYSRLKNDWAKNSLIRRSNNKKEISFKKFSAELNDRNFFLKFKNILDDYSDYYFRRTMIDILEKRITLIFFNLFLSFVHNPFRFLKKIIARI